MDVITNAVFWGDVGLAMASKLALIVAGLWGMKIMAAGRPVAAHNTPAPVVRDAEAARPVARRIPGNRVANLEIPGLARTQGEQSGAAQPNARTGTDRDRMRERLMEYLEQQQAGRQAR